MDLSSNIPTASSPLGSLLPVWLAATLLSVLEREGMESRGFGNTDPEQEF